MGVEAAQQYSVQIAASPRACFETITDFDAYPRWSSAIERVAVLERDSKGVGRVVEFHIDMRFKSIRYVLEYAYEKPEELTWVSVDGDIESIEGAYHFSKLSPKVTEAACRQAVRIGFWVPGPLRRLAERSALQQSVDEFKVEVERRVHGAAGKRKQPAKK
jgi:ribosome-associated toxin RatA of RatAB toxin-antitoxin module